MICAVSLAAFLAAAPSPAPAAAACPAQPHYGWMGDSVSAAVTIPSLTQPNGIASYAGTALRPADEGAFPGARPIVLLQHGLGGSQCALWWAAQDLAGHGYQAVVWTSPQGASNGEAFVNAVDAMRSAIAFVRTPANPFASTADTNRIALGGHSLGSIVASFVQGGPDPGVRAAVAFDNLRCWVTGDPGAAGPECANAPAVEITPRVPALGFAKDEPCDAKPDFAPADLKQPGFLHWRARGVPAMELVMAGYEHGDFAVGGSESQLRSLAYFTEAWLERWLDGDKSAEKRLLATEVLGERTASLLSTTYRSGAYLPPAVDTTAYRSWLQPPDTAKVGGPRRRVSLRRARRHGVRFAFVANEPAATFECRLDGGGYRRCKSPKRVRRIGRGRHTCRVRATDAAGGVEAKPARWRFRVTR